MKRARKDGGPAFPTLLKNGDLAVAEGGMPLRDYFAAHAPFTYHDACELLDQTGGECVGPWPVPRVLECLADMRMAYADAMLRAREAS